jgi:carbonic anhydrase
MSATDDLLRNAESYAATFDKGHLRSAPARKVAVVACMDARLNPYGILGLSEGDAHVIRNAGGVVTDEEIRSLAISQHMLGTEEIMLIHHTDCGMLTYTEDRFPEKLESETGVRPDWTTHSFTDLEADLRKQMGRIEESPFIPHKNVRAFVYEVESGRLREVT